MSNARKITAIALITLIISVALLGSGWITQTVSAVNLDDAIDLKAAPHFRDLTYTVGKPSYSTGFDDMGKWKVSIGNPRLAITQSNLVITAPSASPVCMTLTASDAPGINKTERSTIQLKVAPSNVTTAYTNITLAANSDASDFITASFHGGLVTLAYTNAASTSSSTLYSPARDGVPYVIAFELAESGTTAYLYDSAGDLLANKLLDVADVHAGTIYAIHVGCSGLASGKVSVDYAFVTTATTDRAWSEIKTEAMSATSSNEPSIVQVDPTKLKMIRSDNSITSSAYGMDSLASVENDKVANMFGEIGSTAEPSQRFKGQFVAVGWDDFRGALEGQLKTQIAKSLGILDSSEIYLVDYYIDYLQLKTSMDQKIVNNELASYRVAMADAFKAMGIDLTETDAQTISRSYTSTPMVYGGTSVISLLPPGFNEFDWLHDALTFVPSPLIAAMSYADMTSEEQAEYRTRITAGINLNPLSGIEGSVNEAIGKIPDWQEVANYTDDKLKDMYNWTTGAIKEGISAVQQWVNATYMSIYSLYSNEVERWNAVLNTTMAQFATMSKETLVTMTGFFDATTKEISSKYQDMNDKLANLNQQYMNWSNSMMVNTNAMFTQLFYDLSEQSKETQRYFIDQMAKGNEAVANISDSIALSASQTNAIFADLLSNGKVSGNGGLSFGAFLGDDSTTVTIVLVAIISMIAVVVIFLLMGKRKKTGRQRR